MSPRRSRRAPTHRRRRSNRRVPLVLVGVVGLTLGLTSLFVLSPTTHNRAPVLHDAVRSVTPVTSVTVPPPTTSTVPTPAPTVAIASTAVPRASAPTPRRGAPPRAVAPRIKARAAPVTKSTSAPALGPAAPHIMVVMMENESQNELIGSPDAPNTNALADQYGEATQSYAIAHPSLPNYLELLSGSDSGVTDDGAPSSEGIPASTTTLANQLEKAGISWKAYMESMPSAGYTGGDTTCCGGQYYQHHNPFVYYPSVTSLPDFTSRMVPSTSIMGDLDSPAPPDFVWVTPNGADDMHDGPTNANGDVNPSVGDAWLGSFVSQVQSTGWYAQGGRIVVEWDEGADSDTSGVGHAGGGGGGHIVTIVVSAALKAKPQQDATPVNTAGVLRSIEGAYGLPHLADAADPSNGNIDSLIDAP